ncbi:MAG TPA: hypothetical protein VKV34_09185, partial [Thermoleophilia bacterium]|nr:hypothetical protein [Thermoleophilia bacterium]
MSRRTVALSDVTRAVRDVASGDARCAIIMPAEEPHHSIHLQGEPGILWAEIQPSQALLRAGWDTEPNEQLLSLGWRPRNKRRYGWYQYFHPTRTRHHRELTRHLKRTFREALDVPGELTVACIDRRVVDPRAPTFETGPTPECTPDHDL